MHFIGSFNFAGVSAIRKQLTWGMFVLFACPYSASTTRNVQLVGKLIYVFAISHVIMVELLDRIMPSDFAID